MDTYLRAYYYKISTPIVYHSKYFPIFINLRITVNVQELANFELELTVSESDLT
jgi:hypothetical protein